MGLRYSSTPPKLARLKELLSFDPSTGVFTWNVHRPGRPIGSIAGAVGSKRGGKAYREISLDCFRYKAHRMAWFYHYGVWPSKQIDHINGDKDDNRIANLREASNAENCRNAGRPRNNTSGFKGVSWHKGSKKWAAHICCDFHQKFLGNFATPEEAHEAYVQAATKLHGSFGRVA